jgi:hypothetical protein
MATSTGPGTFPWFDIAAGVKTRNHTQCRTHAQKCWSRKGYKVFNVERNTGATLITPQMAAPDDEWWGKGLLCNGHGVPNAVVTATAFTTAPAPESDVEKSKDCVTLEEAKETYSQNHDAAPETSTATAPESTVALAPASVTNSYRANPRYSNLCSDTKAGHTTLAPAPALALSHTKAAATQSELPQQQQHHQWQNDAYIPGTRLNTIQLISHYLRKRKTGRR